MSEPIVTDIFLRFADAAQALTAAKALGFAGEDATELPTSGWWHDENGNRVASYAIDVVFGTGIIRDPETGEVIPGFHINGRWVGDPSLIPDFGPALIMPTNPACVFS